MTTLGKIQIALLVAGALLIGWELRQSASQRRELASIRAASEAQQREIDARQAELDEFSAKNKQLQDAETRAGNETLLALLRERSAATLEGSASAPPNRGVGPALTRVLDNKEQQDVERELMANKIRADMGAFFRLANLPPERVDQFVALSVEAEQRKAARFSALLHGTLSVADALRERDNDQAEFEKRQHDALGDSGYEFLNGIADGMRNDEAKRLLKLIQQNMGANVLTSEQSDRLQPLIKNELISINIDNVDLFRPLDDLTRQYLQRQEELLRVAAGFLTPAQIESLRVIAAYDLADRQKRIAARRKSLGIK